ncbi:MDR family MFS transporter [Pantoea sp. Aalb]|uniref:MDR family MFS transporter n=1 Tax=Pantoea sp. Aalb TaxID=2576762 RepID=UPI0013217AD1|nr:MDR family MFS transporter [Pantoea sp. Aalb]MXP67406.1 MFS transporter [Pantoea sp. Aalb]
MDKNHIIINHNYRLWILVACMLAMFMVAIEVTIVATAMPTITIKLGKFSQFSWVFSIYLVTQAVSVPLYGRLADIWGRKLLFFIGISVFLIGSILCGLAHNMIWLIVFRAVQGIGAGSIIPLITTIIADIYLPHERANVQGWLSSVWGISAIIGPLSGAWLVQNFNWSVIFWINVPIGIISMVILAYFLPAYKRCASITTINLTGSCWMIISITALLVTLLQANVLGCWLLPFLLLTFVATWKLKRHEQYGKYPLFPVAIWHNRLIIASNAGNLIIGANMMGVSVFLPTWIQSIIGGTPLESGIALAMMSIGWPLSSTISGKLMLVTSYRFTAQLGSCLLIAGNAMLLLLNTNSTIIQAGFTAFIIGTGMGMTSTTFLVSVQNYAHDEIRSICTASIIFSRMIGSAIGTALMGAVLNFNLSHRLPQVNDPMQKIILQESRQMLSTNTLQIWIEQVAASLQWVFMITLIIALLTLWISCFMPHRTSNL